MIENVYIFRLKSILFVEPLYQLSSYSISLNQCGPILSHASSLLIPLSEWTRPGLLDALTTVKGGQRSEAAVYFLEALSLVSYQTSLPYRFRPLRNTMKE